MWRRRVFSRSQERSLNLAVDHKELLEGLVELERRHDRGAAVLWSSLMPQVIAGMARMADMASLADLVLALSQRSSGWRVEVAALPDDADEFVDLSSRWDAQGWRLAAAT